MALIEDTLSRVQKRLRRLRRPRGAGESVFLLGDEHSSTSIVRLALSKHALAECVADRDAVSARGLPHAKRLADLVDRSRALRVVFEPLSDVQRTRALLAAVGGRVVWICRHFEAVVHDRLADPREHRAYLYSMLHRPDLGGLRSAGVSAEHLELVRDAYDRGLNEASCRALVWYVRNSLFFQEGLDKHPRASLYEYGALCRADAREWARLSSFLGLSLPPQPVHSPEVPRRLAATIDPGVRTRCESLWLRLNEALACARGEAQAVGFAEAR